MTIFATKVLGKWKWYAFTFEIFSEQSDALLNSICQDLHTVISFDKLPGLILFVFQFSLSFVIHININLWISISERNGIHDFFYPWYIFHLIIFFFIQRYLSSPSIFFFQKCGKRSHECVKKDNVNHILFLFTISFIDLLIYFFL